MSFKRADRVADRIQQELSDLLLKKVNDPRVGFATFTEVRVSDDLRNATVFVSIWGDEAKKKSTMDGLESGLPFFEREVFKRLGLKVPTHLYFKLDESRERSEKIEALPKT